jgi:hypothetical protein
MQFSSGHRGVIIPPLPEKNAVQKFQMGSEFIEDRRRALQVCEQRECIQHGVSINSGLKMKDRQTLSSSAPLVTQRLVYNATQHLTPSIKHVQSASESCSDRTLLFSLWASCQDNARANLMIRVLWCPVLCTGVCRYSVIGVRVM